MKKITVTTNYPDRKLVAVVGISDEGYFVRDGDGSRWIGPNSISSTTISLEELAKRSGRSPVYEGDSITIQF